ncbi:unnamed protein product [Brassicogethes aeneus]|uniref:Ataxin-10 domain-containing protein n=1 Tax=Brassicogethes aeneus TaxID=1431903 RepID=A0A9P0AZ28_BRAAE|nr:unnamed protein product [Brassicogethes aeneus]
MCKNLDYDTLNRYIKQQEWKNLAENLKNGLALELSSTGEPKKFHLQVVDFLQILLNMCLEDKNMIENVLVEVLRGLRNCVTDSNIQESLLTEDFIIKLRRVYLEVKDDQNYKLCTKIMMQLLINLSVKNPNGAKLIYNEFSDISECLEKECNVYEVSALLHYMSLHVPLKNLDANLVNKIVDLYHKVEKCEFLHFLLETICQYGYFWSFYNALEYDCKLTILGIIKEKQTKENKIFFVKEGLDVMMKIFIDSSQTVFTSGDNKKALEISLVLQILSQVTGNSQNFLEILQSNSDLLIQAAILLINIHRLGKSSDNCFTQVPKHSEVSEDFKENPAYGFKGDLVRFIGNLNWTCKKMQDLTREAELIPVILECCNIDEKNPFIMQWAIFAIRNICKNNLENQKFIAAMKKQGTVDGNTLNKVGLTLNNDGDKSIGIVNLDDIRNN